MTRTTPPSATQIRLLLVDDHEMVRDGMIASLSLHADLEVAAVAPSLEEAKRALSTVPVDVVITDLQLGDGMGTELVDVAQAMVDPPAVLLITGTDERTGVDAALDSGCAGFVSKSQGFDHLVDAIHAVAEGAAVFPATLLLATLRRSSSEVGASLSEREREVLQLLAEARTTREIAGELYLSEHTVRNHIRQILNKLEVRSQLQAVVIGARNGIVDIV